MAENGNASNKNGHSPYRRYVPPTGKPSPGSGPGQVMPFPQPRPLPPRSRRSRSARNRWRQWLTPPPAPSPGPKTGRSQPVSPTPERPPAQHRQPPTPMSTPRQDPLPPGASFTPSASVRGPGPSASPPPGSAVGPRPIYQPRAVHGTGMPTRPSSPSPVASKVTPLRRRPPAAAGGTAGQSPHRGRTGPRQRVRTPPRPVLYGIRLLIVGTGIAAIAGTLLSGLNPAQEATSTPTAGSQVAGASPNRSGQLPTLTRALPLAEELAYLETELMALEAMTPGLTQAVFVYDLDTGNYVDLNGSPAMAAASTIKVPILIAFLEAVDAGTVRLNQAVTLREDLIGGGSGDMQTHEIGRRYTALEVATAMSVNSDNTATNLIIDLLGGASVLNQRFREWGLQDTVIRNPLPDLEGTNTTSPADLVRMMALVDQGELLSLRSRDRFFSILQRTRSRDLIPAGIADETAIVYNKTGDIGGLLGDIALVDTVHGQRYLLGVLVERPSNDGRAGELIRRVASRVHQEMSHPLTPVGGVPPEQPTDPATSVPAIEPPAAPATAPTDPPTIPQG